MSWSKPDWVEVAADGEAALLVGGVDEVGEAFGGVGRQRQKADVVDGHGLRSQDRGEDLAMLSSTWLSDQLSEVLEGEPDDFHAGGDGLMADVPRRGGVCGTPGAADHDLLVTVGPL